MTSMSYIGLDVHKKTISYCVKDASGQIHREGKIGSTRRELDWWMKTLPLSWTVPMEATIFSGWIYDQPRPAAANSQSAPHMLLSSAHPTAPFVPVCRISTGTKFAEHSRLEWEYYHPNGKS